MKMIDQKLDLELCSFLQGWHNLEGDDTLIDMHLSPAVEPRKYQHRYDVLKDIEQFLAMDEIKNHDHIHRKMQAHQFFLLKTIGEKIDFADYLKGTMNIQPIFYTEGKIAALKDQANELLSVFDLKIQENVTKDLCAKDLQIPKAEIVKFFDESHHQLYAHINKETGVQADFSINYKEEDKETPTIAEIRGDGKQYDVKFNMYHMKDYGAAYLSYLSLHEITCHAVQFANVRRKLDAGEMPLYMGYATVHEPVQFSSEGLAESLQYFYPQYCDQSPMMQAVDALRRYKRVVSNNAAYMLNNGGKFKDAVEYVYENAPDYSIGRAATMLANVADKPLGSSYSQVYSQALETFREISETHPDKNTFIKSVYEDFLMPEQIISQARRPIASFV